MRGEKGVTQVGGDEDGKGKREERSGRRKEGRPSLRSAPADNPRLPPISRGLQLPARPRDPGTGPAPDSPAPVVPHVTAAAAAPAGTCSLGRGWGWGWARRRAGAGRAGAGPSPVTSCGAAGAGAALQRLRRRRPRLVRLPASLRPPPARRRPPPSRPLRLSQPDVPSSAPSSFPSSPPPRTAGRGTSPGQQPGETAGPDGAAGAGGPRAWGLGRGGPARSRPCSPASPRPGLFLPPAGPSRRRRALPRPPAPGRPARPGPRGAPSHSVPRWGAQKTGATPPCLIAFPRTALLKLFSRPGREGCGGGVPLLPVPGGPGHPDHLSRLWSVMRAWPRCPTQGVGGRSQHCPPPFGKSLEVFCVLVS